MVIYNLFDRSGVNSQLRGMRKIVDTISIEMINVNEQIQISMASLADDEMRRNNTNFARNDPRSCENARSSNE